MKKSFPLSQFFRAAAMLLLTALFFAPLSSRAERPHRISKQRENRFLFVIDTSSVMSASSNAIVQDVVEMLESDMAGEFREGDTIGLWTYSDKLRTEFPMQIWSKADKDSIVADVATFLQGKTYGKRSHFGKVMPALNQVIKNSERLTLILFSDGAGSIEGTPLDKEINNLQKQFGRELRETHVPFVTVLAAHDGAVFYYAVNYPGLVSIPHTANPEVTVKTNAPVPVIVSTPAPVVPSPPPVTHSLIMRAPAKVVQTPAPVIKPPAPIAVSPPAPIIVPPPSKPVPPPVAASPNPAPVVVAAPAPIAPQVNPPATTPQPRAPAPIVSPSLPVANISPPRDSQLALFIIAISLLTIAVALVVFLIRRSRHAPQSSLITQSIDRPR
jgi:hypothetical protein